MVTREQLRVFFIDTGVLQGLFGVAITVAFTFYTYGDKIFGSESFIIVDSNKFILNREESFIGWYVDIGKDKKPVLNNETVSIKYYDNPRSPAAEAIRVLMGGDVWEFGIGNINKSWEGVGYKTEDYIRFAYYSSKKGTTFTHGVYVLEKVGGIYKGYWEGKDSMTKKVITGAYLLTKDNSLSKSQVKLLYKGIDELKISVVDIANNGDKVLFKTP